MASDPKEVLRQFARDVNREVAVRTGDHKAQSEAEKIQAAQGCCELYELDAVRSRVFDTLKLEGETLSVDREGFVTC